jgi:hypothetical protein
MSIQTVIPHMKYSREYKLTYSVFTLLVMKIFFSYITCIFIVTSGIKFSNLLVIILQIESINNKITTHCISIYKILIQKLLTGNGLMIKWLAFYMRTQWRGLANLNWDSSSIHNYIDKCCLQVAKDFF